MGRGGGGEKKKRFFFFFKKKKKKKKRKGGGGGGGKKKQDFFLFAKQQQQKKEANDLAQHGVQRVDAKQRGIVLGFLATNDQRFLFPIFTIGKKRPCQNGFFPMRLTKQT